MTKEEAIKKFGAGSVFIEAPKREFTKEELNELKKKYANVHRRVICQLSPNENPLC